MGRVEQSGAERDRVGQNRVEQSWVEKSVWGRVERVVGCVVHSEAE